MKRSLLVAATALVALALAVPVLAHHSFSAEFDAQKPVTLTGVVTKVEWMNPHIWFYIDVKDSKGAVTKWQCEGANPNTLVRLGWSRDSLKIGSTVDIDGWRAKDGTNTCNARTVVVDGKRLFAGSSAGQ